jgi:recombination protein RecA
MVMFTNQIRMKIGVMFGNPETTSGGNALKFYSSVRLDIRRIGAIAEGENVTGSRVRVKVVKNKVAPPFRKCEFDILYGEGISREGDLIDLGVDANVIRKSGAWFSYGEERLGQGRENVRVFLKENPDIKRRIEAQVFEHFGIVKINGKKAPETAEKAEAAGSAPAETKTPGKSQAAARTAGRKDQPSRTARA